MGAIRVHEFISLDSVIDTPSWTFEYGFDPRMGEAIGRVTTASDGILLGRTTYEMFEPAWSKRTAEQDPVARRRYPADRLAHSRVEAELERPARGVDHAVQADELVHPDRSHGSSSLVDCSATGRLPSHPAPAAAGAGPGRGCWGWRAPGTLTRLVVLSGGWFIRCGCLVHVVVCA